MGRGRGFGLALPFAGAAMADNYRPGDYYVCCDRCGYEARASETRRTWDNLRVHSIDCWEPRHPQDFVRGRVDRQAVPNARPEPADIFLDVNDVTAESL